MSVAGAIVSFLAKNLGDQLVQEASFLYGVRNQFEWLETEFRRMDCFLKASDTESKENVLVKNWRREVRDIAYVAEDVIDTFIVKVAAARHGGGFMGTIKRYAFIFKELKARHEVASKIERIKINLRSIIESRSTYGIGHISGRGEGTSSTGQSLQERMLPSPFDQVTDFVGVTDGLDAFFKLLTSGKQQLSVVSIVGRGGLSKTTLAKRIYNHEDVKKHFQSRAWASVSQNYAVGDVLQAIIKSCMVLSKEDLERVEKMIDNELKHKIADYLQDKTYLIVLDDLWAYNAWDDFKDAFPNNNRGSRILLTTRNVNVALHADAESEPHRLRCLSEEESRELLCRKVPLLGSLQLDSQFKSVAVEIVRRCHGLPLAIVVIGGLLSIKEPQEWNNVLNSISWQFVGRDVHIRRILSLCYKDLPYHLKPCFLYLGVILEDYEFRAEKLIQLWAAEGLLEQRWDETLKEVGEDYLKELVQRSLIQIAKRSSSGGIKTCRTHNLIRDLSKSEANEEMFLEIHRRNMTASAPSQARRLAIPHHIREHSSLTVSSPHLRSLLLLPSDKGYTQLEKISCFRIISFKLLRVLDLKKAIIKNLPSEIGALIHLRYLGFRMPLSRELPSYLGSLYNLQTLNIAYDAAGSPPWIPKTIGKMQRLTHLLVEPSSQFDRFFHFIHQRPIWGEIEGHPQLDQLSNLQTLMGIEANSWIRSCLAKLTNLKKLGIRLDEVSEESCKFILTLDSLHSLFLWATSPITPEWVPLAHLIKLRKLLLGDVKLEKLPNFSKFPRNLAKLTLIGNHLKEDPLKTLEQLKSLQILRLLGASYVGESMLCSKQGFRRLKTLYVEGLPELKE